MYRSVLKWFQKVRVKDTFDGIPENFKFHSQSATWEVFHVINYANIFSNNLQNFHLVCASSQNGRTFNVENIFIYQIVAHVLAMYTDPRLPSYSTCISSKRKKKPPSMVWYFKVHLKFDANCVGSLAKILFAFSSTIFLCTA